MLLQPAVRLKRPLGLYLRVSGCFVSCPAPPRTLRADLLNQMLKHQTSRHRQRLCRHRGDGEETDRTRETQRGGEMCVGGIVLKRFKKWCRACSLRQLLQMDIALIDSESRASRAVKHLLQGRDGGCRISEQFIQGHERRGSKFHSESGNAASPRDPLSRQFIETWQATCTCSSTDLRFDTADAQVLGVLSHYASYLMRS